jgi:phospholipid-binding lipoprotein MlaA
VIFWHYFDIKPAIRRVFLTVLSVSMIGCATIPAGSQPSAQDPWESFNRSVFSFNEVLDDYLLRPVTTGYRYVVPSVARDGINNFFGNYNDIYSAVNQLLQGNPGVAAKGLMRVVVNTVFGLGGLIDMATPGGLPKHKADFGQTFGVWGIPSGPYVVLPFFGPSSVRDTFGTAADIEADYLLRLLPDVALRNSLTGLRIVNARNNFYQAGDLLEGAAIDKYSFVRDGYIQRRQYQIDESKAGYDDEETLPPFQNPYE